MRLARFARIGATLGAVLGAWNFVSFWMDPLDDTVAGMLVIYLPMFICWPAVGFVAARRTGRLADAAKVGAVCAFCTFVVFWIANIIRVNVFLDVLREWPDWRTVVDRYHSSGIENFRTFVNYDYLRDAPLKLATPTAIGTTLAVLAGIPGRLLAETRVEDTQPS